MVQAESGNGGFLIRKETFIKKNEHTIDSVYDRTKKVSLQVYLVPLTPQFFHNLGSWKRHVRWGEQCDSQRKRTTTSYQDDCPLEDQELGALPSRGQDLAAARSSERHQALRVFRGQKERVPGHRVSLHRKPHRIWLIFVILLRLCTGGELFDRIVDEEFFSEEKACLIFT